MQGATDEELAGWKHPSFGFLPETLEGAQILLQKRLVSRHQTLFLLKLSQCRSWTALTHYAAHACRQDSLYASRWPHACGPCNDATALLCIHCEP